MIYSDDKIRENIAANEEAELAYSKWYAKLPDEKKAKMIQSGFDFVAERIRREVQEKNPFCTKSEEVKRFIEVIHKDQVEETIYNHAQYLIAERIRKEWQERFKVMKKQLGWSYEDMANFIGASSAASVKASVNRKLPAFAKLAVCVFEEMSRCTQENKLVSSSPSSKLQSPPPSPQSSPA